MYYTLVKSFETPQKNLKICILLHVKLIILKAKTHFKMLITLFVIILYIYI